jgi:L-alanine-DL-glutamate epimerase-like enolase superfamily enzyme
MNKPSDIRVSEVQISFENHLYRAPIKFGGVALDRVTLLNVECEVIGRDGKPARGFGSMPLSNIWAFPSRVMDYDLTLRAMTTLAERCAALAGEHEAFGHPVDLGVELEEHFLAAADEVSRELQLAQPIPKLATLVVGSPFDAALHDAFGKAHGLNCYHTYGREFMSRDLGAYLGADYAGEWLDAYVRREPQARMPLYHLVGALDPLDDAELTKPVGDGLPETLPQWIRFNGLTHMKIKLNGDDLAWDLERILKVDRLAAETQRELGVTAWHYSLDFNERCQHVDYLIELIHKLRERAPAGFDRVQYIEQPTARDLRANPQNRMHEAAKLKPVVIDESLTDLESLLLAHEMGYTGAALKACKGQSQSLLMAAAAQKLGMFLCVQDLTCPGASLIHSAGLAAHVPGVAAIEANSRQYCPGANRGWEDRFPGIFQVRDGTMDTSCLTGPGLGAVGK